MNKKKLASLALVCVLALGLLPALASVARADGATTTYTLTIPAALTVSNSGWNATSGITANNTTNDFDTGKKLTVTAASTNSWALVSGSNSIGYNLATATGDYSSTAEPASWEFTAAELNAANGTNKSMGIIVEDYSAKPAGTYQDTVTFTASVENDSIPVTSVSINNAPTDAIMFGGTGTLTATVSPDGATDKTVTWSSSNSDIVSIDSSTGAYEVKGYGSAIITATAGGKTDTCTITGTVTYTSLSVNDVIHVGDTVYATPNTIYVKYDKTNSTINSSLGVYTLTESNGVYQWNPSNGKPVSTKISVASGSDGIYVVSGGGTSMKDRMTFAAHTNG